METNNTIINRSLSKYENKFIINHYVNNAEIRVYFNPENTTHKEIISSVNNYNALVEALTELHREYRISKIMEAMRQGASNEVAYEFADNIKFIKNARLLLNQIQKESK